MNGGVTPFVAGELARGAMELGRESYGVDILRRVLALGRAHGNHLHAVYTGAETPAPAGVTHTPVSLRSVANLDPSGGVDPDRAPGVCAWTHEGDNDIASLPTGRTLVFGGVPFELPERRASRGAVGVAVGTRPGCPPRLTVPFRGRTSSLHLLHACSVTSQAGFAGSLAFLYADGSRHAHYLVKGRNVADWWMPTPPSGQPPRRHTIAGWTGSNPYCMKVGLLVHGVDNPFPDREIVGIELAGAEAGAAWLVLGITASNLPVSFPALPVSWGFCDSVAASSCMTALIEGVAGVADRPGSTALETVLLSPRWAATGTVEASSTALYPASGGYVSYHWRHEARARRLLIEVTGSGTSARLRVLLPDKARKALSARVDGRTVQVKTHSLEDSAYAELDLTLPGPVGVEIAYAVA
jgi:hypothetical protein